MYDFSDLKPTTKEMAVLIIGVVLFLVVVFSAGYYVGLRNAGSVPNNGTGIDDIREQYQHIEVNQQQITSGLNSAVAGSHAAAETAGRIEERAGSVAESVADAGVLIDECQQLIGTIRNRGKAGKAPH